MKNARDQAGRDQDFSITAIIRPPSSPNVVHHGAPFIAMRAPTTEPPGAPSSNAVLQWYRVLIWTKSPIPEWDFHLTIDHTKSTAMPRASSTTPHPIPLTPLFTTNNQPIAQSSKRRLPPQKSCHHACSPMLPQNNYPTYQQHPHPTHNNSPDCYNLLSASSHNNHKLNATIN